MLIQCRSGIVWGVVVALACGLAGLSSKAADAPASAPTATATQETNQKLQVTVADVSGLVQVRANEQAAWQAAKVGMVVDEGAEFRTGPRSSVRCTIPPDQSFTLDRLGTVKVLTALQQGSKLKTEMVMKYGRTKYSVEAAGLEHEGSISSPTGTLAVRGTVVSLYDQPPYVPEAVSYTGQAAFRDAHRRIAVGGKGAGKQTLVVDKNSAAETALANTVTDPKYAGARTEAEAVYIANEVSPGGVTSFDPLANILVVRDSTPIQSTSQLSTVLPGQLDIVARWFGNANVNLEVFVDLQNPNAALNNPNGFQANEFLYPGYGLNVSKSGGEIPYDDRGGPNGGTELAFWNKAPQGVYGIGAVLISGPPVDVEINAFLNGKLQSIFFIDSGGNFVKNTTLEETITSAGLQGGPLFFIPPVSLLEDGVPVGPYNASTPAVRHRSAASSSGSVANASVASQTPNSAASPVAKPASAALPVTTAAGRR
jgi:hypothetical protein